MNIAVAIFTYNRSRHTKQVIDALEKNIAVPEKLFIFQDGLKDEKYRDEWERVNQLIRLVNWCDCETIISEKNKGLADSIVDGINYVFNGYDAVIVLEDDCVPQPGFMTFMTEALQKYQYKEEVYSVSGYAFPVDVKDNGSDAYFLRRISSWGWGTWKNRWKYYQRDYRILGRIKNNVESAEQLRLWGEDLECYLLGNMYGQCNSWAAFWALTVIERNGYCLSPYKSLLRNIGLDGTGVHCGANEIVQRLYESDKCEFKLPDKIEISSACQSAFTDYFTWTPEERKLSSYNEILIQWISALEERISIADLLIKKGIHRCSIWGRGKICDLLLKEFRGKIEVLSIVESHPAVQEYRGIPVVRVENVPKKTELILVIPVYDFYSIEKSAKQYIECGIIPLDRVLNG